MKTLLLCNGAANQRALAAKLHQVVPLHGIGIVRPVPAQSEPISRRILRGLAGYPFRRAWISLLDDYDKVYPQFPLNARHHEGVNAPTVIEQVEELKPDLVIVSGTDLLRRPLIKSIKRYGRVVNLHTGISPFIKGGPNCTNWALSIGRPDLIGNTIMWLDAGIDSGNIITTERTPLTGLEPLRELHRKVMDHAHDLYVRTVSLIVSGSDVPSVNQALLGDGRLFLTKHWNAKAAARAVAFFYIRFGAASLMSRGGEVLVPLPEKGATVS